MADGQAQASQRQSQSVGQNRHSGSHRESSWNRREQSGERRGRSGDRGVQSEDRQERSGDRREQSGDRGKRSGDRKDRSRDRRDWSRNQAQGQWEKQRGPNQQSNYHHNRSHHGNTNQYNHGNQWHNYQTYGSRGRGRGRGGFGQPPPRYMDDYNMQGGQFGHVGSDLQYFPIDGQMQNYWGQQGNMGNQNFQEQDFQRQQYYNTGNSSQYQGSRRRDEDDTVFLSKTLSYILRHGAEKQGFQLMKGGFLYVDEILKRTQKLRSFTVKDVESVVQTNDKQRFALERDEKGRLKIRANQGHTIEVDDLDLEEITLPVPEDLTAVIHGTYYSSWEVIKKSGLSRMSRNHVHFAPGEPGENGVISGMRKTCEILIYVDIEKALKDGLKFYRSANNVILCPGDDKGIIYPCYFTAAVNRNPRQKLEFDSTITKDTVKHEPMANAGKYAPPVGGVQEPEGKKKKKKNKRKNKDKEMDEAQTESKDDTTEGESKPAAKKKAMEDQKEISETWDCDEETSKLEKSENGVQEGSQIGCETGCHGNAGENCGSDTDISSSKNTDEIYKPDNITGFSGNSTVKEEEHEAEQATHEEGQDLKDSLASSSSVADAESSSVSQIVGAEAGPKVDSEMTIIADGDQSISAVEFLRDKKPEVMAVCCYGDNLGKEKSKIYLLVLITDDLAYIYHLPGDSDEVIKKGHVKELFEDPKINKVFNRIGPQSLSIAHEWDILLDGTPIWDLTILYDKLYKSLPNNTQQFIEENNLDPTGWTDDELTSRMRNHDMDKDIQPKLLQRGRDMLKLYRQFHMDQMKGVKKYIYHAASPHEGFMSDKIKLLKEQRKEDRKKKEKEEKNQQSKQQAQSPKKHGKKKQN